MQGDSSTVGSLVLGGSASDRTLRLISGAASLPFPLLRQTVDALNEADLARRRAQTLLEDTLATALLGLPRAAGGSNPQASAETKVSGPRLEEGS